MKKLLDYVITKTREYQIPDCEGNKFCADTNEGRIKEAVYQFMIKYDLLDKGLSVNFLYEMVASYKGVFEPLRKQILQAPYDAADCELHCWCLLVTDEKFKKVAEAVGTIFVCDDFITLSAIRKLLEMRGCSLPLAQIKFVLKLMIGLGIVEKHDCSFTVRQKLISRGDPRFNIIGATIKALKIIERENDLIKGSMLEIALFPFLDREMLEILYDYDVMEETTYEQ